ncbi:MAG: hypothetical protein ABI045_06345 [Flavobacteriales bacterium]
MLYWIAHGLSMAYVYHEYYSLVHTKAFIPLEYNKNFYILRIDPYNGDFYMTAALDYRQKSKIYRYSNTGVLIDVINVGIIQQALAFFPIKYKF